MVFGDSTLFIGDIKKIKKSLQEDPYTNPMLAVITGKGGNKVPPITALTLPGGCFCSINTAKLLDDIYVKYNKFLTKTNFE